MHNKIIRKMHNKKSKTWKYFEDDGNIINCKVLIRNLGINYGAKHTNLTPKLVNELLFLKRNNPYCKI